jgi:HemY protein
LLTVSWGKARRLLEQTASAEGLPSRVRRQALRVLARIARQEDDEAQAGHFDQRAAALD